MYMHIHTKDMSCVRTPHTLTHTHVLVHVHVHVHHTHSRNCWRLTFNRFIVCVSVDSSPLVILIIRIILLRLVRQEFHISTVNKIPPQTHSDHAKGRATAILQF